jgi:mono/diheme cytochrome c family protein
MKLTSFAVAVVAIVIGLMVWSPRSSAAQDKSAQVERGKYLVEQVARCGDCHSPVNEKGEPIPGKELRGGALMFKPMTPIPVWADKAPNIAGLRGWDEDAAIKFLMTGIAYNDLPARPPMPPYRLNREDAEAIVAFLKSLSPVGT